MPNYDYRCPACGHEFEVSHAIADPGPKKCPKRCGTRKKPTKMITKAPAYHSHYSPMHPRVNRGRGY